MDGVSLPRPDAPRRSAALRQWLPTKAAPAAQVGLQFVGDHLLLARVHGSGGATKIETVRSIAAPAAQRSAVLRTLKREGLFRSARLHLLLAPGQYDVHQQPTPAVPPEELHDALRWQLRGALGYPPEEALLDFTSLPQPADAPARQSLLVVTARRSVVSEALTPLIDCGLAIDAVDVPEFAQRNLAQRALPGEAATHGWLAFDQDTCLLTANCVGELAFARRMLLPNAALNAESEADPIAHFVERMVAQVQRSLDLFERQSGLPPVTQMVIGPHPHAAAIAAELGGKAAVRVQLAESTDLLRRAATAADGATTATMAVLGAAMRLPAQGAIAVQQIDLQRTERPAAKDSGSRLPGVLTVLAAIAALAIHLWLEGQALELHQSTAARLRSEVQRAENLLVAIGAQSPAQASTQAGAEADVAALEALAARLADGAPGRTEPFSEPLRAFARARAEGVWLTGIRLNNSSGQLVLEGKALEAARVPQLLAALQRQPRFTGIEFAQIELQPAQEPAGAVQFRIATASWVAGTDASAPAGSSR